ncbi:ATP-binding cassette domain-containing protein [Paracoccus limosus]|uniref:ATP-binding cassette domain-containing protein n=1 Tax=Paracoccus limosus TaxID=913252 RepID=A0A844HAU6_9RHOB|nr:ABC transporter ATP-binding protein [Paracoccus limosus]MTH35958.1 ATP-binding cassette domain-containing protein [Paracoccus limosus]
MSCPAPIAALAPDLLTIRNLRVHFPGQTGEVLAVDGVDLTLRAGEIVGLVGESGSGKSVTAMSILRLVPGARSSGQIALEGRDLIGLGAAEMRALRGDRIGMVFQNPMTSLNPAYTIGNQLIEAVRLHRPLGRGAARKLALTRLAEVGLTDAARVFTSYPHELSGGMRQRAMIAMAMICAPALLIADEPTTALGVTTQAQILHLLDRLRREHGTAILLITHDLAVVAAICDRVAVMYAGSVVEEAPSDDLIDRPRHPYTRALIEAIPSETGDRRRLYSIPGAALMRPDAQACAFAPRCATASERCRAARPPLITSGARGLRCWHPLEVSP